MLDDYAEDFVNDRDCDRRNELIPVPVNQRLEVTDERLQEEGTDSSSLYIYICYMHGYMYVRERRKKRTKWIVREVGNGERERETNERGNDYEDCKEEDGTIRGVEITIANIRRLRS